MGSTIVAVLAGWLMLAAPPPTDATSAEQPAAQTPLDETAAIERAEGLAAEGWKLWQERQLDAAVAKFEEAVQLDPHSANAWNGLGWALFNNGNAEKAAEAFEKCVALEPEHPAGLNGLGQIYLMWAEYDKAEKFLTKASKANASAAWYGLARLYLFTGKYDEAQAWIKKSLREQPGEPTLKKMLAAAKKGELPDDLKRELEPAGKQRAGGAESLSGKGWQQFFAGKPRSAEQNFRRALAKDPEHLAAINGLGF